MEINYFTVDIHQVHTEEDLVSNANCSDWVGLFPQDSVGFLDWVPVPDLIVFLEVSENTQAWTSKRLAIAGAIVKGHCKTLCLQVK